MNINAIDRHLSANRTVGVPYTDEMINYALADLKAQATPDSSGLQGLRKRYDKVNARDFDGNPYLISEMDALVAYLQMTGTLVDFSTYEAGDLSNRR